MPQTNGNQANHARPTLNNGHVDPAKAWAAIDGTQGAANWPANSEEAGYQVSRSQGLDEATADWSGAFVSPLDFNSAAPPRLQPALVLALTVDLPHLELPHQAIHDAAWQSNDEWESIARRVADERTHSEPVRRQVRGAINSGIACIRRFRQELEQRLGELDTTRAEAPRYVWQALVDSKFVGASPFAVRLFWGTVIVLCVLILSLAICSFFAIRRLMIDTLGDDVSADVVAFSLPMVVLTAVVGKLRLAGHGVLGGRALRWTQWSLIACSIPILFSNMALIGAQQTDLSFSFDIDPDGLGTGSTDALPWYTNPSLRLGMVTLVDLCGIICLSVLLKLKLQQVTFPKVASTQAHEVIGIAADNANNLLAALDGLYQRLQESSDLLTKDRECYYERIIAAFRAERLSLENSILQAVAQRPRRF